MAPLKPKHIAYAIAALFLCLIYAIPTSASQNPPTADKGVLDLRGWDFSQNGPLEITGEWEFHWNEFIDPNVPSSQEINQNYIQVPGTWLGLEHNGTHLGKYGHASYRLKILLPKKPIDLAFYLQRVQDAYRVYVNGKLWMQAGHPDEKADNSISHITREFGSLKGQDGELDIVIQLSNHSSYAGGGFFNTFKIGPEANLKFNYLFDIIQDFFLSGALVCLGIFMVTLHIGRFREKAYFVLYVMAFAAAVYVITSNSALLILTPSVTYHWSERLGYISGAFLIALIYEFIHQINKRKTSLFLSQLIMYQAAAISICVVLWPRGLPVELVYVLGVHLLVVSLSCINEVRHALAKKTQGRWLITMGIAVLVFVGAHDLLHANGLILSIFLAPYGILILLLFYAAILAFRVNSSITQNEQLAKAIWSMDDSVAIFDNRDQVVIWNKAYFSHLSSPAQKMMKPGTSFFDLVHADAYSGEIQTAVGKEKEYIQKRMERHENPGETFEMHRPSGWFLYREAETPDGGRVTFAADLSQQKAKEDELQKAFEKLLAANEAKTSFLSNMSHELRTPLNAINGFSEMMVKEVFGPLNTQYQDYTNHIHQAGKHLLRLVTDMLDVARIETGKLQITPEEIDLNYLLEDCIRMEQDKMEAAKLHFSKSIPDDMPILYADPIRVRQIVLNLMDNAIKFTKADGKITLTAEVDKTNAITVKIADSGVGIAKNQLETALKKFGQVRQSHMNTHEGLGLGLSIAQILMQLHGGKLSLESELGVGTCASITFLPIADSKNYLDHQSKD